MDAAARVFAERGYADATVQDVADELGILKGSLYHYIRTKEDLLFRLYEEVHAEVDAILERARAADAATPPLDRLAAYVADVVEYSAGHLALLTAYHHELERLGDERRAIVRAWQRPHVEFVTAVIAEAQRRGDADPSQDPGVLANLVLAATIWMHRWYRPSGPVSAAQIAQHCAAYARLGVRGGAAFAAADPQVAA
jgi:TetR/AcrR family transcriptional regulator, cholesterol catabolism regulator